MWKSLSIEYRKRLILAEVPNSDADLVEKYQVKNFPAILILPKTGEIKVYQGLNMDHVGLLQGD
jgi:thioredoxin-related protein